MIHPFLNAVQLHSDPAKREGRDYCEVQAWSLQREASPFDFDQSNLLSIDMNN